MKRTLFLAVMLASSHACIARDLPYECASAAGVFKVSMQQAEVQYSAVKQINAAFKAGTITREDGLARSLAANDLLLRLVDSADISLRFMLDNHCYPANDTQLQSKLAENESALKDLRDERTQFDTLRKAMGK